MCTPSLPKAIAGPLWLGADEVAAADFAFQLSFGFGLRSRVRGLRFSV